MATGALIFLFSIAGISTFLLGLTAYLYLRRPLKALIVVYMAFVSIPFIWILRLIV